MAFCGFETSDMATECVHQLHRSYCRNQKLMAEFATPLKSTSTQTQSGKDANNQIPEEIVEQTEQEKRVLKKKKD